MGGCHPYFCRHLHDIRAKPANKKSRTVDKTGMHNNTKLHGCELVQQMLNKLVALTVLLLFSIFVVHPVFTSAGSLYKWVDDEGVVHMTDSLSNVPPKYRNQVEKKTLATTAAPDVKPEFQKNIIGGKSGSGALNSKHFEVPYKAFEGNARRIIIPVTFNDNVTADLLLDTGSPGLLISPTLADRLGIIGEQEGKLLVMAAGIGGYAPAVLIVVETLSVGEARSEFHPATVTKIPSDDFEGLVGMDFVVNYKISIDSNKNVVVFDELPPQSDKPGGHDENWWRSNFQNFSRLRSEWGSYLDKLNKDVSTSETERLIQASRSQYDEADKLYRKLERFARDNAVPIEWRH
jgi:hypothetical protein